MPLTTNKIHITFHMLPFNWSTKRPVQKEQEKFFDTIRYFKLSEAFEMMQKMLYSKSLATLDS